MHYGVQLDVLWIHLAKIFPSSWKISQNISLPLWTTIFPPTFEFSTVWKFCTLYMENAIKKETKICLLIEFCNNFRKLVDVYIFNCLFTKDWKTCVVFKCMWSEIHCFRGIATWYLHIHITMFSSIFSLGSFIQLFLREKVTYFFYSL